MRIIFGLLTGLLLSLLFAQLGQAQLDGAQTPTPLPVVQRRALIVAASGYDSDRIGADVALQGPKNDAALMIRALRAYGVADADMIVLVDDLNYDILNAGENDEAHAIVDGLPYHDEILTAFEQLVAVTEPGDEVIIYFSGHGSRQPQPAGATHVESDGFDEVFLPLDIGRWEGARADRAAGIQNALIDDDIGRLIDQLRSRDAFIWLIVDSCHSGGTQRGAGMWPGEDTAFRTREISMADLGVPASVIEGTGTGIRGGPGSAQRPLDDIAAGPGFVAFYAAHSGELALEAALPRSASRQEQRSFGVMTYQVASALMSGGIGSYRDLALRVLNGYDEWGNRAPQPLFEGDLDRSIFGALETRIWPVERQGRHNVNLPVGVIDGVGEGAVFQIRVRDPSTQESDEITSIHVQISALGQTRSTATTIAYRGVDDQEIPRYRFLTAQLVDRGVVLDLSYKLQSRPRRPSAAERVAMAAIETLATQPADSFAARLRQVRRRRGAEVRLVIEADRIWFLRGPERRVTRDGRNKTPGFALTGLDQGEIEARIEQQLQLIARQRNLVRVAHALQAGDGADGRAGTQRLDVEAYLWRARPPELSAQMTAPDDWSCALPSPDAIPDQARRLGTGQSGGEIEMPQVRHCDILYLHITNTGQYPIDVTPLYLDASAGINVLSYLDGRHNVRLDPGTSQIVLSGFQTWDWDADVATTNGIESVIVLAVEHRGEVPALPWDFSYLRQNSLNRNAGASIPPASALSVLLEQAVYGGTTRAVGTQGALDDNASALVIPVRLMSPEGAQ